VPAFSINYVVSESSVLIRPIWLKIRQSRSFYGDAGDYGGFEIVGAVVSFDKGFFDSADGVFFRKDHQASAEASAGDLCSGDAGSGAGDVGHKVYLRGCCTRRRRAAYIVGRVGRGGGFRWRGGR